MQAPRSTSFIESIRLEDGEIRALSLHQHRLDLTLLAHFGAAARIDLAQELSHRALPASGLFKVRVTYDRKITDIDVDPYTRHAVGEVAFIAADDVDYRFKYADRSALDAMRRQVAPGVQPIMVRHGLVTDALFANVCFFDGTQWLTPAKPMLEGTARAAAIAASEMHAADIRLEDIKAGRFTAVRMFNCMTLFAEALNISLTAAQLG